MRRSRRTTAAVAGTALALALAAGACSSDDGDDEASEAVDESTSASVDLTTTSTVPVNAGATIEVSEFRFEPDPVTIAAGETVTWANIGSSRHTVTASSEPDVEPSFKSPPVQPDDTFVQVFNDPGTYDYFCSIHPDQMRGQVIVE